MLAQVYSIFCSRGYVMFAARPGSKPRYSLSEMDQNVKTAIRYVKQHAAEYKIDPTKLGITGASAGGHLASLAALTPTEADPNAKKSVDRFDTTVRAVGVFFPPTDLLDWNEGKMMDLKVLGPLLFVGGVQSQSESEIKEAAKSASPLHRVGKPTAPFLIIHGDADSVVPLSHSKKLAEAINQAGGAAELIVKSGGGHPWLTIPEEVRVMADWFDKQLGATTLPIGK
jgi:acetyl esterase/lipase